MAPNYKLILILTLLLFTGTNAYCWECNLRSIELNDSQYNEYNFVAKVKVIKVKSNFRRDILIAYVQMEKLYKGVATSGVVKIHSGFNCGDISPMKGEEWLIFGNRDSVSKKIYIPSCSLSKSLDKKKLEYSKERIDADFAYLEKHVVNQYNPNHLSPGK